MVSGINYRIKEALAFIKSKNLWLEFERDPSNPSDSNAVKIIGCSKTFWGTERYFIGFLAKGLSKYISQSTFYDKVELRLSSIIANDSTIANVFVGSIEIKFDIIGPVWLYQTYQKAYDELIFHLESVNQSILHICKVRDKVSLWVKPDKSGVVIFTNKGGLVDGEGKIGFVPRYLQERIIENISNGGDYISEIISIDDNLCEIKSKKLTPEEVKKIRQEATKSYYKRIADEILKPYKPKTSFTLDFLINERVEKRRIKKGDVLNIITKDKEYYLLNLDNLEVEIHNSEGNLLGKVHYPERTTIRDAIIRILKSVFSGYFLDVSVINVKKDGWVSILINPTKRL